MCGGFFWKQAGCLLCGVTLCIAVSLCVVSVLAKCVHTTEVGIAQCADARVVNVALVALYGLSTIGVAAFFGAPFFYAEITAAHCTQILFLRWFRQLARECEVS